VTESLDLLFIHVPKSSSYYPPYGEYMTVNLLPMGTWSLADLAQQRGYRTEILHLGLEWIEGGDFSPLPFLREKKARVAAIPLHWHAQSYDVMRVAREIKRDHPSIPVVLGGYTASLFHREILSGFPQIDAVVRGDAEIPLPALMEAVDGRRRWGEVPNLTWRDGAEIRENPLSYWARGEDLEAGAYVNAGLLKRHDAYMRHMGLPFIWAKGLSKEENRRRFHLGYPIFPLSVGRGCTGDCTWCGGGARAQYVVNGRRGVVFRSPEKVADTVAEAREAGYDMIHIAFDPGREGEQYYRGLFPLLEQRQVKMRCYFESFSLPSDAFLQAFRRTFIPDGSRIALSPESGDERVRHRNKTFSYSNEALMRAMAAAQGLGIQVDVFFAMGIPGEQYSDLAATAALRREIRRRFKNTGRIWTSPISLEPASPWHMDPEAFGIVATRRAFVDFYRASGPEGGGLGYYIPDYLGDGVRLDARAFESTLRDAKCREHCSFHPRPGRSSRPFWGRMFCRYMRWRLRGGYQRALSNEKGRAGAAE